MAEKPEMPLREYSRPSTIVQSCIIFPPVDVSFEIDPSLISFIMTTYQFGGLPSEDPNRHLQDFLLICATTKWDELCKDGLRLRLFSFSLKDKAILWFYSLLAGSITTWDQLATKFLAMFFPPSSLLDMRRDILKFAQFESESLYEAKERFLDLVRRCRDPDIPDWYLHQIFFKGLTPASRTILDVSLGSYLRKYKPSQAYDLLDDMNSTDFQWHIDRHVMPNLEKLPDVSVTHTNTVLLKQVQDLTSMVESLTTLVQKQQSLPQLHVNDFCREVDYLSTNLQGNSSHSGLQPKEFEHQRIWY